MVVRIGGNEYNVKEAKTDQEKIKGLQGVKKLSKDEGMLFYFDPDQKISMWMKDTKIPLDIIFINEDQDPVMKVLAPDGSTQMELWGGERIVSRRETKILIKKAKAAEAAKGSPQFDNKCRSLGKYIFKVIKGQDTRPAEYVDNKNA